MSTVRLLLGAVAAFVSLATMAVSTAVAQTPATNADRFSVPATVSPEAATGLSKLYTMRSHAPKRERPKTQEDWDLANAQLAKIAGPMSVAAADALHVTRTEDHVGGVPVLRVRAANYKPGGATVLYLHGGAYTFNPAANSLTIPALMATSSGHEVISIDYALAPRADWHIVTDQVVAVWKAVLASGVKPENIGIMGDSAGGGLAAGSVLKIRDQHLPLPGALYLMSPSADLTGAGDTSTTLAPVDPVLAPDTNSWSREAYATAADQKNPYVSPVYGDYTQAFPPTLIQVGTREMLLSGAVRAYQAIRGGSHEGMPHLLDCVDGSRVGFVACACGVLVAPALLMSHSASAALIGACMVGLSAGMEIAVLAYLVPRYFGVRHYGLLFAVMNGLVIVGLGVGPLIGGSLFDHFGNYRVLLLLTAPLYAASAILFETLGRANKTVYLPAQGAPVGSKAEPPNENDIQRVRFSVDSTLHLKLPADQVNSKPDASL